MSRMAEASRTAFAATGHTAGSQSASLVGSRGTLASTGTAGTVRCEDMGLHGAGVSSMMPWASWSEFHEI